MKDDLSEKTNLAEKEPERTAEMTKLLDAWLKETKAKFPTPNPNYKNYKNYKKYKQEPKNRPCGVRA